MNEFTLLTKVSIIKAMVFPVVTYGCESWIVRKAERRRIDAFKTVVLEKTPESPLDSKEIKPVNLTGNQPWILIGRTDAEAEAPILCPLDANSWLWCWERLKSEEGDRGWDGWMALLIQWTWVWVNYGSWWWARRPAMVQSMGSQSWTWLSD